MSATLPSTMSAAASSMACHHETSQRPSRRIIRACPKHIGNSCFIPIKHLSLHHLPVGSKAQEVLQLVLHLALWVVRVRVLRDYGMHPARTQAYTCSGVVTSVGKREAVVKVPAHAVSSDAEARQTIVDFFFLDVNNFDDVITVKGLSVTQSKGDKSVLLTCCSNPELFHHFLEQKMFMKIPLVKKEGEHMKIPSASTEQALEKNRSRKTVTKNVLVKETEKKSFQSFPSRKSPPPSWYCRQPTAEKFSPQVEHSVKCTSASNMMELGPKMRTSVKCRKETESETGPQSSIGREVMETQSQTFDFQTICVSPSVNNSSKTLDKQHIDESVILTPCIDLNVLMKSEVFLSPFNIATSERVAVSSASSTDGALAVLISHPHGFAKSVSFGEFCGVENIVEEQRLVDTEGTDQRMPFHPHCDKSSPLFSAPLSSTPPPSSSLIVFLQTCMTSKQSSLTTSVSPITSSSTPLKRHLINDYETCDERNWKYRRTENRTATTWLLNGVHETMTLILTTFTNTLINAFARIFGNANQSTHIPLRVKHTATSCPGSSGGAVVLIGRRALTELPDRLTSLPVFSHVGVMGLSKKSFGVAVPVVD